jgi:hypothetical protein
MAVPRGKLEEKSLMRFASMLFCCPSKNDATDSLQFVCPHIPQLNDKQGMRRCLASLHLFDTLQKKMRDNYNGDLHAFWRYAEMEPRELIQSYLDHFTPCVSEEKMEQAPQLLRPALVRSARIP